MQNFNLTSRIMLMITLISGMAMWRAGICAEDAGPAAKEGAGESVGTRMDQRVIQAAAKLLPDAPDDGELVPGLMITEGADGFMVTRYAVMQGDEEKGAFFRVTTMVGEPERDVAVRFDKEGTLLDLYDLNPPKPKTEPVSQKGKAKQASGNAPASAAEREDALAADPKVRGAAAKIEADRIASQDVVGFLIGRKPAAEAESMAALLRGIARAATLISKAERDKLPEIPMDAFTFDKADAPKTKLPVFSLKTLDKKVVTAPDLGARFKAVFLTALQSDACKDMNLKVAAVLTKNPKYADRFLWVLADAPTTAVALARKQALIGRIGCDEENAVATAFGVAIQPMLLVYDEAGLLVGVVTPDNLDNLSKALELLGK